MKINRKKIKVLFGAACIFGALATGCSSGPVPAGNASEEEAVGKVTVEAIPPAENPSSAASEKNSYSGTAAQSSGEPESEAQDGRWHVLDPETAAAVDADFEGTVWKTDNDTFYIAENTVEVEGDIIFGGGPSSDAQIPDSDLIQVVYDENTYFYTRNIYDGGSRHEDVEAGPEELEIYMTVEMKGNFKNDIFYADEIRMAKVH